MPRLTGDQQNIRDGLDFFLLWLRRPTELGAVLPSSPRLARAMAAEIDPGAPGAVVELGAGTGSVTRAILDAGVAPADLIVIEREPCFCHLIGRRFPGVGVLEADARNLAETLAAAGVWRLKAVVSSLPLVSMTEQARHRIAAQVFASLAPGGTLVQFTYAPTPPLPRRTCDSLGLIGARRSWVGLNLPPAFVWRYGRIAAAPSARAAA